MLRMSLNQGGGLAVLRMSLNQGGGLAVDTLLIISAHIAILSWTLTWMLGLIK
jgi:hypothetical protein